MTAHAVSVTLTTRKCAVCHTSFVARRPEARTCSARCRQRRCRGTYEVTAEDRAAMERAAELVPVPVPFPTPEQVRAHILATVWRGET